MAVVAGVDVGKASLDVSVSEGPVLRFDNTTKGITKLLRHLAKQVATLAVCEPTGGYERLLVSRLRKAEVGVRVANPSRVRAFARACGYEAKTDPLDAQVLSLYGQVLPESETPAACRTASPGSEPAGQGCLCRRSRVHQAPYRLAGG